MMFNSILLLAFLGGATPARAVLPKWCSVLLADLTELSPSALDAWTTFRDRARRLATEVDPHYHPTGLVYDLSYGARVELAARRLVALPLSASERESLCYAVTPLIIETKLIAYDAHLVEHLIDQLCGPSRGDVYDLTTGSLALATVLGEGAYQHVFADDPARARVDAFETNRAPARHELRRWLGYAIERLDPEDWRSLTERTSPALLLPVLDAVGGAWDRLRLAPEDHLRLAVRLLEDDWSVGAVGRWTGFGADALRPLIDAAPPLQWLEFHYRHGTLDDSVVRTFETRAAGFAGPVRPRGPRPELTEFFYTILYDARVPFATVERIFAAARSYWPRRYREALRLIYSARTLDEDQIDRAERAFGRVAVRPELVHREKRRYAMNIDLTMAYSRYSTPAEFIRAARLSNHFTMPACQSNVRSCDPVDAVRVHAAAEVFVRALRRALPRVLNLPTPPTVAELRWLLEAPGQFAPFPVLFDEDNRGLLKKLTYPPDEHYDTARHARALTREVLDWGLPRITTAREWTDLVSASTPPGRGLPNELAAAIDRHVGTIIRVGDPALDWLGDVSDQAWFGLSRHLPALVRLKNLVGPDRRNDQTLSFRAIARILTLAERSPTRARRDESRALFAYLAGRASAGAVAKVHPTLVRRLRAVAFEAGYYLDDVPVQSAHALVQIKERPR